MKVLIACECSGTVRDAFIRKGHEAISCDLLDTQTEGPHYKGDVRDILYDNWDLIIAHPPCTYFTTTGARWFYDERYPNRYKDRDEAFEFFKLFVDHPCKKKAIENPIGYLSTAYRKPDQIIQPYQFGHSASKATCLWLFGLPKLVPTKVVDVEYITTSTGKRFSKWYWDSSKLKGEARRNYRSKTFEGIAEAMAEQWT